MAGKGNYKPGKGPKPKVFKVKPQKAAKPEATEGRTYRTYIEYSEEVANEILKYLSCGMSLAQIEQCEGMPTRRTVLTWRWEHPDFSEKYTKAREAGLDAIAEDILNISDDGSKDWEERLAYNGGVPKLEVNGEVINRSKLRVDSRKWLLGKLAPRKYGEKQQLEMSGKIETEVSTKAALLAELLPPEQLAEMEAKLQAK
jgi:hypothetical protein